MTGKKDVLRGLKENVAGRLIPAGTGMEYHDKMQNKTSTEEESMLTADEIEAALRQELQETEE